MAKDSRPYSSPNFSKEKKKSKGEGRPYSSPNFPKEEEPKSSAPAYNQGIATGTPKPPTTSVPAYNQGIAGGTNNKSNAPAYNQGVTGDQKKSINSSSSVQQQNKANIAFINNLNPVNTFSVSPFNMLSNAEVVQAFNAPRNTPTSVSNIKKNLNITTRPYSSPNYKKELYKSIQAQQQPQQPTKLRDAVDNDSYWRNNRKQSVSYATSIDYYNMNRKGYDTVYIEDGNDKLKDKGGVLTIGRDRLEGLPRNIKTVLVDGDGNWKYLVDTTTRAAHAEALQGKRDAATKIYEYTADKETRLSAAAQKQRDVLYNRIIKIYQETVNKDKSPENLRRLQAAVNALSAYDKVIDDSRGRLTQATAKWAKDYEYYNVAMRANTKWTVEEEAQYQQLLQDMKQTYTSPEQVAANATLFTQFAAMSKRREANKSCAAYLDTDFLYKLKDTEKAMAKAVDMYNKWDSVTIHMEEGEDLGTQLKRLIAVDLGYDPDEESSLFTKGLKIYDAVRAIRSGGVSLLPNIFSKDYWNKSKDVYKDTSSAIAKQFTPLVVAYDEYNKAADAYREAQQRIIKGNYKDQTELNNLYAKRTEYLKASDETISQGKNIIFNNTVSNLSVFDTMSVQHTFVAWRMAAHPERYKNDPKFEAMQKAYKDIYGTDFLEDMDAGKMAMAMLKVKLGTKKTDYIYLDGSDLRHSNKEKYGFWGSLAVGMLTDVSALTGIAKGAVGVATRRIGARAVTEAATDSFLQSLVRAGVTQEVAEEFVTSSAVQRAIRKDVRKAISKSMKNGGDDMLDIIRTVVNERARMLDSLYTGEISNIIDDARHLEFFNNAKNMINNSTDITKSVLNIEKGTVLTHALGNIDDALNDAQSLLFKATCPAAGAVVGIAHINKAIKSAKNLKLASESELHRVVRTAIQAKAEIDNLSFKSILGTDFRRQWQGIQDEWYNGVIGRIKEVSQDFKARPELYGNSYEEIVRPFSECSDYLLRESANSYTYHIIHELDTALDTYKLGEDRFAELLKLAQENGYETFDDMLAVIEDNIKIIYDASPDAKYIVDAFKRKYDDAILKNNIANIRKYVDNTAAHVDDIRRILNTDGTPIISKVNATINPVFVQQNAKTVADSVFDFLQTVNNDYTTFVDEFGKLKSIHETGTELINALNNITLGDLDDISILRAQDALRKYIDEMDTVYLKQLKDWEANTIQDAIGVQDYLKNINAIVPDHAGTTELQNNIADIMQKFFEEKGVSITTDEIFSNILKSNPEDFLKLPEAQQASLIYRVMENKGSNLIGQVSDANLKIITDGITDCNAQLGKNLRLLQINLPEDSEAYQLIGNAISSACAIEHTRMLYTYLKASNVDSTLLMTIMDVLAGGSNKINSILQMYPSEISSVKLSDYIIDQVKYQLSQHNGQYSLYKNFGCNSVDVGSNVLKIEEVINNSDYSKLFPADDNCIDICMSTLRSTDGSAPKDIAFHVRGSKEAPTVLRKNSKFTVYSDDFAKRTYGSTAQQLNDSYAALGNLDTLTDDEWIKQFKDYINKVKQQALEENKTIRFIGFNTSNAVSGDNKFISDILRANGVNANTANAIDFADIIRAANNQYVFDSNDIEALTRGLRTVADTAKSKSITLGVRNILAYDPKYTCVDMLEKALKDTKFDVDVLNEQVQYILESTGTVSKGLGTEAYNEIGLAMGTYINATAFAKVLDDAGLSSVQSNKELMKIITNATVEGEAQLGLHKIIENAMDDEWIDRSKFVKAYAIKDFNNLERVHDSVLQINRINEGIHRADLITDKDVVGLKRIFNEAIYCSGLKRNSHLYSVARAIKVDDLTPQQLYSATKWVLDNLQEIIDPDKYNEVFSIMLIHSKEQATKLTDMGYKFIRDNIVDYTNDSIDAFLVKYLDTSEEGYKFAQALDELAKLRRSNDNLKNYMDAVEGLFNRYEIHGVQDRMVLYQLADVHAPIMDLHDEMLATYDYAYGVAMKELQEEATMYTYNKVRGTYSRDMMERVATERAVRAAKQHIIDLGETARSESVQAVANLDADAFRAHLIRNCCGGLIIDPTSKAVKDIDLVTLFEQWRGYGVTIDAIDFSQGTITNKKLFRVYIDDLGEKNADEIFTKYNNTHITFDNHTTRKYSQHVRGKEAVHIRHSSFDASDMTLMNANHVDAFRDLFFKRYGGERMGKNILDLNTNFKSWANELYNCNMWADMELKQLVNPYYTDNMLNNLAQTTHQLRNNITAVHDLGTIVNNRYMNSKYILRNSGVLQPGNIAEQRKTIVKQITDSKQHLCKITLDKSNRFKVVDYTPRLLKKNTSDEFFEAILNNTVMLDEGMMECLADWSKSTSIALKMQASNAPDWIPTAYNLYKKTIRSATVTMYLYGNLGTAIRNFVDSSTKGANEVMQYNGDMLTYLSKYKNAVSDVHEYTNIYRQIEEDLGTVNHETITKFFGNNTEGLNKFNILYGYEQVCGESILQEATIKELHSKNLDYLMDGINIDRDTAEQIRKSFDGVYGSLKYYGMTNAQLEKHMVEISEKCREAVSKNINRLKYDEKDIDKIMEKFWDYHPTVTSWGDKMTQFPVLGFNKARFNNAETRARLAIYQTFLESGASEVEAIKHVTATQFHYAGLGKVEDFMPFTQYKLYNALYWFDHANARAVSTAWRAAQFNGDGAMTNEEISNMIAKYRQKSYYIYDAGMDEAYDNYFQNTLEPAIEGLFEVDSYLGVPRESGKGNFDLNGTHYLKLGNSFIDELDLVTTCMASAAIFASTMKANLQQDGSAADKIRWAYQSLKYTPLYDSFYSPWKSYADLVVYTYDHYKMIAQHAGRKIDKITSKDVWDCYKAYLSDKTTRSVAVSGIPVIGAILSNLAGRWKSFNLNAGLIAAVAIDPDSRKELFTYARDMLCDVTGMFIPSVVGTKVEPDKNTYNYYRDSLSKILIDNPGTFFDMYGRLQREMGFTEDQAKEIMASINRSYNVKDAIANAHVFAYDGSYVSKQDYYSVMRQLYCNGFTHDEIVNMFKQYQISIPERDLKRFMVMSNALPAYIRYDKEKRTEIIAYYKAMGMSSDEAWAKLINNPAIIENGKLRELSYREVLYYNDLQQKTYEAIKKQDWLTDEEWDAYWNNMAFRYPKGKWSETYHYLVNAGYTSEDARRLLLNGYMLDENGMLVDVPGKARARVYSYSTLQGAEWDAYWNSLPDYTKYEKGAFGRTMRALKKQGYSDEQARLLIQQGIYVDKNGNMMNVTGMQRPVLGFPNFSAYYNSIPEYCRYEKGAFKRTYAALRKLGFGYEQSLKLIQEGAYLLDMSLATSTIQTLGARRNKDGSAVTVTNITTLMAAYGGQVIIGDDGKPYIIIDCRGLSRPRKNFGYSRRGGGGGGGRRGGYQKRYYPKRSYTPRAPKIKQYKLRKPFIVDNNVSTFSGFTNFRGSNKLTKPYTTKGYVSTFSAQNFLNGSSYGMRKTYKIDMRQFKSGALSTKSAYPTSYRNIVVAYRRSMYKDLYAKYGMSRMRMRSNQPGYSNASIVRLRRNEIQNRERYAERRDTINKLKLKKKASD